LVLHVVSKNMLEATIHATKLIFIVFILENIKECEIINL
jgi:hypothetical protein